jgi:hypothetical protein
MVKRLLDLRIGSRIARESTVDGVFCGSHDSVVSQLITMSSRGMNVMLASAMALLSYVPFEWVAKGTLLLCVFLFVVDPFPPMSRILSIAATLSFALLSRAHRSWHEENRIIEENEAPESPTETSESPIATASKKKEN